MRTIQHSLLGFVVAATLGSALACAQTNSKDIMARSPAELVAILNNPSASVFEKAKACQRLAVVGTKEAVPALAALLPDEKLNDYARCALEGLAAPEADRALRDSAAKLHGRPLVGVIDSIGARRDTQATAVLKGLLENTDAPVASAAAGALGRIGTPEAATVLQQAMAKSSPVNSAVAEGCLTCADGLAAAGNTPEAVALVQAVVKANVPKRLKIAALAGQFRFQQGAVKDLLLAQIRSADRDYFNLGLAAARYMPGADVTAALASELEKLPPPRQALLLLTIGDRRDAAPIALFLAAAKGPSPEVCEAAIRVLAKRGDVSAAPILVDAALGETAAAQTARKALESLPGREVDAAITARLADADAKAKTILLPLIGARQIAAAMPAIRQSLTDANEAVRLAALAAYAQLAAIDDLDWLIGKVLAEGTSAEVAAARAALKMAALRMGDRDACAAKLALHLNDASAANQAYLLDLLGSVGGAKALEAVAVCAKSSDPAAKDAATRILGEWPSADAAPILLDIAKSDPHPKYQVRALRGYIRIARQLQLPAEMRLAMFRTTMEVARRDQEKQLALDILSRIPSAETLNLAVSQLGEPSLKEAAADAAVTIAGKLVVTEPKAVVAAMEKVIDAHVAGPSAACARQFLGQASAGSK